jgi:hypothetical protein
VGVSAHACGAVVLMECSFGDEAGGCCRRLQATGPMKGARPPAAAGPPATPCIPAEGACTATSHICGTYPSEMISTDDLHPPSLGPSAPSPSPPHASSLVYISSRGST